MKARILLVGSAVLALAACGGNDSATTADPANMEVANSDVGMDANAMDANAMVADQTPAATTGQQYANMAGASDLYEIQSSQLAQEKAKSSDVKDLARMLIADHQKSTADLKAAAAKAQPAITVAPKLDPQGEANMAALRSASDADFDQTYLQQQIAAHQKALTLVQGYAQNGDVPSLKEHASTVAGPIQKHLDRAQQLAQSQ